MTFVVDKQGRFVILRLLVLNAEVAELADAHV